MGIFDGNPLATMVGFGTAAGNVAGSMYDANSTNQANEQMLTQQENFNASQAQKQMDFQTQMSDTASQRKVADLKAAGLNPMLAGINQQGESAPSGAMATAPSSPSRVSNISGGMNSAVQNATALANAAMDVQNKQDQGQLLRDQASNQAAQASGTAIDNASKALSLDIDTKNKQAISDATLSQIKAATANSVASTGYLRSQKDLSDQQWRQSVNTTQGIDYDNAERAAQAKMWTDNPWLAYLRPSMDFMHSAAATSSWLTH